GLLLPGCSFSLVRWESEKLPSTNTFPITSLKMSARLAALSECSALWAVSYFRPYSERWDAGAVFRKWHSSRCWQSASGVWSGYTWWCYGFEAPARLLKTQIAKPSPFRFSGYFVDARLWMERFSCQSPISPQTPTNTNCVP